MATTNAYFVLVARHLAQVIGGMETNIWAAVLLQAYRWISDSRDEEKNQD